MVVVNHDELGLLIKEFLNMCKFVGSVGWADMAAETAQINRSFLRNNEQELVVEFHHGGWLYTATLTHREDNNYIGNWIAKTGGEFDEGIASCQLYDGPRGRFLFGQWKENHINHHWWGNFDTVEHFPDEAEP